MSGFLQKIHDMTKDRVDAARRVKPLSALRDAPFYARTPAPVIPAFAAPGWHVIAEVKFASPSEGDIRMPPEPAPVAQGYLQAGARMLSVLTEPRYFKGSLDYLAAIRAGAPDALLLRKDFICDAYQLHEARAHGADAVLLIVAMTDDALTQDLLQQAAALGLTALVEVHDADEMARAQKMGARMIGVNNRNLKTLKTTLDTSRQLAPRKAPGSVLICESGLSTDAQLREMRGLGYDGFLMGTHFMKKPSPGDALAALLKDCAA
ncbi:MAG TPA: indole-3-glycerol phosphate synthase TrpC [Alphaproteobacteria bacterium]|nr:indole-3-glycerol phosphate synthase TrpC [Alphaproteobacteria bacterium]